MENKSTEPEKKIELHHSSIEEIMGTPPTRMIAIGSGFILFLMTGLIIGSSFLTYSDTIRTQATILGNNPVGIIKAPVTGKIIHTFSEQRNSIFAEENIFIIKDTDTGNELFITAHDNGIIEINPLLMARPYVNQNDTIAIIWENDFSVPVLSIILPISQMKSIKTGNKIRLFLEHPKITLETKVESIFNFNNENNFQIISHLPVDIYALAFWEIRGNCQIGTEITTEEKSLFHYLINPFRALTKK